MLENNKQINTNQIKSNQIKNKTKVRKEKKNNNNNNTIQVSSQPKESKLVQLHNGK